MKLDENEISALLNLIDDPDEEVFHAVSDKLISYGNSIIPSLENAWENSIDDITTERLGTIIHQINFKALLQDFKDWHQSAHHELMPILLLISKFLYANVQTAQVIHNIDRLKKNVWLELNNYLTPIEQTTVISSIIYNYFGLKGVEDAKAETQHFVLSQVISSKKGCQTGNGSLYLLLCELLDIPIRLINFSESFILGFYKSIQTDSSHPHPEFFIDPFNGRLFSHTDFHKFLQTAGIAYSEDFIQPLSNEKTAIKIISNLKKQYDLQHPYTYELDQIISILNQ